MHRHPWGLPGFFLVFSDSYPNGIIQTMSAMESAVSPTCCVLHVACLVCWVLADPVQMLCLNQTKEWNIRLWCCVPFCIMQVWSMRCTAKINSADYHVDCSFVFRCPFSDLAKWWVKILFVQVLNALPYCLWKHRNLSRFCLDKVSCKCHIYIVWGHGKNK